MSPNRKISLILLVALWTALVPVAARAAILPAGSLDPSFGEGGMGEEASPYRESYWGKDVEVQSDGRIMVLARQTGIKAYDLIRYNADGTLDRTFGRDGIARTQPWSNQGATPGVMTSQLINGLPKTLIAIDGATVRYDELGKLDLTFGSEGGAYGPLTSSGTPRDIELSPDGGRIYALADPGKMGISIIYSGYGPTPQGVEALTSDGQVDKSFGLEGAALVGAPILNPTGFKDLAVQPDGRIVISGGWLTARLQPNGDLDDSFGDDGFVIDDTNDNRFNQRLEIDAEGRILVMRCHHRNSQVWGENNWGCQLVRLLPDGQRDLSYGNGGVVQLTSDYSTNLEIDSKGRAVIFGAEFEVDHFTVLRLNPDGTRDSTFGTDGLVKTLSDTGGEVYAGAGTIQPDDKPVRVTMLIDRVEWETEVRVWRYLAEPQGSSGSSTTQTRLVGRVLDAKSGAGIAGATVDCGTGVVALADETGNYSLELTAGAYSCTATATGYRFSKARIQVTSPSTTYDFNLK